MAVVDADLLLLERFRRHRDEEAFAQRVLNHFALAEEAKIRCKVKVSG